MYTFVHTSTIMSCVSPHLFLSTSTRLLDLMNENPDRFYKIVEGRLYDEARRAASAFLGAKAENLVFVPNATTGKTYMYIIQKTWSSLCILLSVLGIRENMSKIYNNYREIYGNLTKMSNV